MSHSAGYYRLTILGGADRQDPTFPLLDNTPRWANEVILLRKRIVFPTKWIGV